MRAQSDNSSSSVPQPGHIPVLLRESVDALRPAPGDTVLDCTAGLGGHAAALAERLDDAGVVVLCDVDPANLSRAAAAVRERVPRVEVVELVGSFAEAPRKLAARGLAADVVLADLGFSSNQMDDPQRGLSFRADGPLDMRLDPSGPVTAAELVNTLPEAELAEIIRDLGEEKAWRRVAQKLVEARAEAPIQTTSRLADVVRRAVGQRRPPAPRRAARGRAGDRRAAPIDPATRTFQALRIAVNDELGHLDALLDAATRAATTLRLDPAAAAWLRPGARLGVITFHSLEDRRVKRAFEAAEQRSLGTRDTRRPIVPTDAETAQNPRSRSAKLRVFTLAAAADSAQPHTPDAGTPDA
jgi:16S rRNA (cytosine1402-N4)-methyltransferase